MSCLGLKQKSALIPLLAHSAHQAVAVKNGKIIDRATFLRQVYNLAAGLPQHQYAINLCEDRYHFLVAFAAAIVKGQCNLLPPSHSAKTIEAVAADYEDCYCLLDHDFEALALAKHQIQLKSSDVNEVEMDVPQIPEDHLAVIAFTSGSTGQPSANPKRWGRLVRVTKLIQASFGIESRQPLSVVATVPPQHMYGLETSILLPLLSASCVYAGRPFFPADIRHALDETDGAKILVTTPIHLRACVEAQLSWPPVEFIISATAPLAPQLAQQAEGVFGAPVMEIYGCTEFGSLANRRTLDGDEWKLFAGLTLHQSENDFFVNADFLQHAVTLSDHLELLPPHRFKLLGRKADMVNIAGKRASLSDLNLKLQSIAGIKDAVMFYPGDTNDYTARLVAFVVAPDLSVEDIVNEFKLHFDPAFMPRPIYKVEQLPREKSGKLPRKNLLELLQQLQSK